MASRYQLEEAARLIEPLRQGDLDGLCGIYAVVNAIRIVVHPFRPLRRSEWRTLFECGLGVLSDRRRLRRSITGGVDEHTWLRVCDEMVFEAATITGLEMFAAPLFADKAVSDDRDALRLIRQSLRDGWPVLVALMHRYNHTSVIVGYSRKRLTLYDSSGHRWTWMRSISFDPTKPGDPHFIPTASVVAVMAF